MREPPTIIRPPPIPYAPAPAPEAARVEHVHTGGSDRWCIRCCCKPGQSLIKKIVHKQVDGKHSNIYFVVFFAEKKYINSYCRGWCTRRRMLS